MIDENLARLSAHRQNIDRYRELLETPLALAEREFVERRLAEEEASLRYLAVGASPKELVRTKNAAP
jgi:hypothetical protein